MPPGLLPLLSRLHNKPFQTISLCHRFCGSGIWTGHGENGVSLVSAGPTRRLGAPVEKSSFMCLVVDAGCQRELGWAVGQKPPWPLHVNSLRGNSGLPPSMQLDSRDRHPQRANRRCAAFSNLALEVMECHFCHILFMGAVTSQLSFNGKGISFFLRRGKVIL